MLTVTFDETEWKLVPVEPTWHMLGTGELAHELASGSEKTFLDVWRHMLAAAPTAPVTTPPDLREETERLREALEDLRKAAKLAKALCDDEDRAPWEMIENRARAALEAKP